MSRLPRTCPIGVTQHVFQRGNNNQICFTEEEDFLAYLTWLKDISVKYCVDIHAWVLMTNHVHLLCTPQETDAVSKMMQAMGRQYVRYFNNKYKRTGTLWEGRFKSCLIEDEAYLLHLYRYIELNPVRASMVLQPADYKWSSYQVNGRGKDSSLCTPHALYQAIGYDQYERQTHYQNLLANNVEEKLLADIRAATKSGMALGSDKFKQELEAVTGRRLHLQKPGRKRKTKEPV